MCGKYLINVWLAFRILELEINFYNFIGVNCIFKMTFAKCRTNCDGWSNSPKNIAQLVTLIVIIYIRSFTVHITMLNHSYLHTSFLTGSSA
jgi:hypothetical protein